MRRRAEFWKRKRRDGTPGDVYWTNLGGERVSTGCRTIEAARRWKAARELERADPRRARAEATTLEDAIREMYAELRRRNRAEATQKRAKQKLAHFPRLWGLECKLLDVDAIKVDAYITIRLDTDGVKRLTVRDELAFLRQTLALARRQGKYPFALDEVMPVLFETGHKPKRDALTEEEFGLMLAQLPPHRQAHTLFFVTTAGRDADARRAQRADFDTTAWRATVRGSKTDGSFRTIPITDFLHDYVATMLEEAPGEDVLFAPWDNILRDLAGACRRAGVPKVTTNGLRRSFGKWHRIRGYSLDTISKLFGHTTAKLVRDVYADVEGDDLAALIETERQKRPDKTSTQESET